MFAAPRDLRPRKHSESRSTDDNSSKDVVRRGLPASPASQRYVRELSLSSHSLATISSQHDDQPGATSARTPSSHAHSTQSTPMTSPSTGYGSLFPGSISSATSESLPSADTKYRSEFGLLTPGPSSAHSPIHGSASSRSSHPVSPRSRSTTESDIHSSAPRPPRKYPSTQFSQRPSTAPQSPSALTTKGSDSPAELHSRSQSRLTVGIKSLLSKSALTSPSRFSFHSAATTPSDSDNSTRERTSKWPITPKKPRPPNIDISADGGTPLPSPSPSTHPTDVHRRYASETAKVYSPRTGTAAPTSQESLDTFSPGVPRPLPAKEQKHRNVLRRRPSAAKLQKESKRAMSSPSQTEGGVDRSSKDGAPRSETMPSALTPAGAVVEAYKQQELHREDASSPLKESFDETLVMSPKASTDSGYAEGDNAQRSPTPYYTVFGTSSGRRVRAGGPEDRWSRFEGQMMDQQRTWIGTPTPPQPEAGGRSLTRKVSSRWKKVKGGGVTTDRSPTRGEMGHSRGRPSFQEVWSSAKSGDREGRMTGRSMDGLPNDVWTSPLAGHARSGSEKGEMKEGAEGGKLWKLMKRLSTGGLRDRYHADNFVPPVPAIPKELLEKANHHDDRSDHSLDNTPQHPSTPHTLPRHRQSASSHEKDHPSTIPKYVPNFATASSSPNSSDVASAQFFHKPQSARSSVSSYGELGIPPVPEVALDRRIITPLEQLRLGGDHVDSESHMSAPRSPRRSTSVPAVARSTDHSNADELPLPSPCRQTCSGDSPSRSPSATASITSHSSKQKSESFLSDGSIALSPPPPRPPRNMRRVAGSLGTPAHPSNRAVSGVAGVPQIDRAPSAESDATAKLDSHFREPARTQLTFRELNTTRKPPLSEREKADIWDDLLARSDQAGGTLHLGAGADELMSDSIRFSTYSEIS